jgi:hypothetical protein
LWMNKKIFIFNLQWKEIFIIPSVYINIEFYYIVN